MKRISDTADTNIFAGDALKGIYGVTDGQVLYWAHHEKLCLVDGHIAFMGGLDLCYGRWDTHQHSIADAHPGDLDQIVFPGQDYNNARIMDFQDVKNYQNNKLDRTFNSRMGWSDVSISLKGPIVEDLKDHFAQRWNFIYWEKYAVRKADNVHPLPYRPSRAGIIGHPYSQGEDGAEPEGEGQYEHFRNRMHGVRERSRQFLEESRDQLRGMEGPETDYPSGPGGMQCQIVRSCTQWSHGVPLEHSIADAYIDVIRKSEHFVYMENQFFITATDERQKPIKNRIGAAIVERIIRAAQNGEAWQMIINIPAIPGFAGDLKSDDALSTRAIMEFQYNSINRGGYSIYEQVAKAGVDPMQYLRFYNLRSYDRINKSSAMAAVEQESGVDYDSARRAHDMRYAQTVDKEEYGREYQGQSGNDYDRYQQAAQQVRDDPQQNLTSGRWDSVAECYMLGGTDLRDVPWADGSTNELDAFVSEELYIHSKLLIADDRTVICGSANLNDRSQLGDHDSEIAILIEDDEQIDSYMAGQPYRAARFAAQLRRFIFRKHLGLLRPQDCTREDVNRLPVGMGGPNEYDWGSREDQAVTDPLADSFSELWKQTAYTNTAAFAKVFHPVPSDHVRTWKDYDDYYERFFKAETEEEAKKAGKDTARPSSYKWGHVVAEEFDPDPLVAVRQVKEELSKVRGSLVEMPLLFLKEEDIAKEGLGLNKFTEDVYT
jgi:phospholipase D1/2